MNFKTLILILALSAIAYSSKVSTSRRLGIPGWAKNALKGAATTIVGTVIDCVAQEIKARGLGFLAKIPGLKMVGAKLAGAAFDKLTGKLKEMINKAIEGAINKLRRRRRAFSIGGALKSVAKKASKVAKGAVKTVGNAAKAAANGVANAAKAAANAAKAAASVAGKAANAMQAVAGKLDKLTGGKLSAALQSMVCPALSHAMEYALDAALKCIGWPGNAPACLIKAIENGCKAAVKAGFKKYRMLRNLRRLERFIKVHY